MNAPEALTTPVTYRARLRFRVLKKLNIDTPRHNLSVAGREVILSAIVKDKPISESEWLVMNTRGFASEQEALQFGHALRAALALSSISTRVGIDAGTDRPTASLAQHVKDHVKEKTGAIVRNNVHGLDVFEDDPAVCIFAVSATGSVLANSEPFLTFAAELHDIAASLSDEAKDVVLLLNYALMRPEPVAQIVFAFSAVEMLGQHESWSADQRDLLAVLADNAERSALGSADERREVAEAIRKSLHKLTLRQGVLRLLDRFGLAHLKPDWDRLYSERSTLVHGLAPKPGADYADLADRSVSLCGQILLKVVAAELPIADRHAAAFYEIKRP